MAVTSAVSATLIIAVLVFDVTVHALDAVGAGFELEGTWVERSSSHQRGDGESQSYEGG
jgi:hypothetical protein